LYRQCVTRAFLFDDWAALTHIAAMRLLKFLPFLLILPAASVPLVDGQPSTGSPQIGVRDEAATRVSELERLFIQLRRSETADDARKSEAEIFIRLTKANSPTVNLLLESANVALQSEDTEAAKAIMMDVVKLEPKFAEGLTRAASLAYQDGELVTARDLLNRALSIEPRHFGAWSGLGLVLEDLGDLKGAQHAYREALYFHPFLDSAKRGLVRLEAKTDGLSL
jgi:tetratricopeptide (TPR) repeat protein